MKSHNFCFSSWYLSPSLRRPSFFYEISIFLSISFVVLVVFSLCELASLIFYSILVLGFSFGLISADTFEHPRECIDQCGKVRQKRVGKKWTEKGSERGRKTREKNATSTVFHSLFAFECATK